MFHPYLLPRTLAVAGILALLTATACSKKDDSASTATPTPTTDTKLEILARQEWALVSVTSPTAISVGGNPATTNLTPLVLECDADNIHQFLRSGTYHVLAGDLTCTEPADQMGTWAFTENQTKIVKVIGGQTITHTIVAMTDTSLQVSGPMTVRNTSVPNAVITYVRNRNYQRRKLITTPIWKISSWKYVQNNGVEIDHYANVPACERDDTRKLSTDTTSRFNDNALICIAGQPTSISGTWAFSPGRTTVTVNKDPQLAPTGRRKWDIVTINPTRLVLKRNAQPAFAGEVITLQPY